MCVYIYIYIYIYICKGEVVYYHYYYLLFRAAPVTYGGSQARSQIGATAQGNAGSLTR